MRHQRVLLTTDVVGGVWDFSLTVAAAIKSDCAVTLLALGAPSPAQRTAAIEAGAMLLSQDLKLEWMANAAGDVARTRQLVTDVAHEVRADVVHANQFAAACVDVDIPVVLTMHSDVLSWRRSTLGADGVPPDWHAYARLVREALARADSVVSVSRFLANEVRTLYTISSEIMVIHNGWPLVSPPSSKDPITLVAGRIWDAAKNITLAAEAAQGQVYLAGEQRHPDTGHAPEIPESVTPLGHLDRAELDQWLGRAAIYLSPARYDPFGLLPLQAALQGCALLLSDIPSYRELWDGAASFFHSNDASDLRRQWSALLADSAQQESLAHLARQRAVEQFTINRVARDYMALYSAVRARVAA